MNLRQDQAGGNKPAALSAAVQDELIAILVLFKEDQAAAARERMMALSAAAGRNLDIIQLGHGNNMVFKVAGLSDQDVVVQLSSKGELAHQAYEFLTATNPNWLPAVGFNQNTINKHGDFISVTVMECCPTDVFRAVADLRQRNDAEGYAQRVRMAVQVGSGLSTMLTDISKRGYVWTDMKPGNILLRANGEVVIADVKAIQNPDMMPKHIKKKNLKFMDVTTPYLSEYFQRSQLDTAMTPAEARFVWEKEYSYQLAVELHYIVTASDSPRLSKQFPNAGDLTTFDFTHPVFASDVGQRMQYMISRLGAHDPANRIRHEDASAMLSVIHDAELFEQKKQQAEANVIYRPGVAVSKSKEQAEKFNEGLKKLAQAQKTLVAHKTQARQLDEMLKNQEKGSSSLSRKMPAKSSSDPTSNESKSVKGRRQSLRDDEIVVTRDRSKANTASPPKMEIPAAANTAPEAVPPVPAERAAEAKRWQSRAAAASRTTSQLLIGKKQKADEKKSDADKDQEEKSPRLK